MSEARTRICDALLRAWREHVDDPNYGMLGGRDDLSSSEHRDFMLGLAESLIQAVKKMDEMTPIDEVTFGQAESEGRRSSSDLAGLRITLDHVAEEGDALMGQYVERLRRLGRSWGLIGSDLGITAQGALKKARQQGWVADSEPEEQ